MADVWLLERKHSTCDERMWKCTYGTMPAGPGPLCTVFRGSLSSPARWAGDERGHWEAGGWTRAWDQTAERQWRVVVVGVDSCVSSGQLTGQF